MSKNKTNKKKQLNSYIKYSSLATQMAVIIIVGAYSGKYLDSKSITTDSFYTIIFSLLSVFLSLYYVLKKINHNEKK